MTRRILLVVGLALVAIIAIYSVELASPKRDYFVERAGRIDDARVVATRVDRGYSETLHLVSTSGLEVDLRVSRPAGEITGRLPVLILVGGHQTGKDAVDLVGTPEGMVFAAIDYPYAGSQSIDGLWQSVRAVPQIQRAFIDTPPALSLALSWLLEQPWVDPGRIELVGVSLGVPFAAAAGGVDERFSRVWLIHGGADNVSWVRHAGRKAIPNDTLRGIVARAALFLVYGRSLEASDWIPEIAPRPLIVIAAQNDDYVPPESQAPFIAAAEGDHVELIWTEGLHIQPKRTDELNQLLEIVLARVRAE